MFGIQKGNTMNIKSTASAVWRQSKRLKALSVVGLFAVAGVASLLISHAATQVVWSTGFESDQTQPTYSDTVDWLNNVGPFNSGGRPEASIREEAAHSGTKALMYSGNDYSSGSSFVYFKSYDVSIPIASSTKLSYWLFPQNANGRCAGIDFQMSDGSTLRDSAARDYSNVSLHPNACHGGNLPLKQWSNIQSDIGKVLAGRTITRIWVAYDQPASTGQFRGYIDDLTFSLETPDTLPAATGDYTAKYWNYSGSPTIPTTNPNYSAITSSVDNNWGNGSPNSAITADHFVAQYSKTQIFDGGNYNFSVTADDGVRLYVDGQLILDKWIDQASTTYNVIKSLTAGTHSLRIDYFENGGGAVMKFNYSLSQTQTPATASTASLAMTPASKAVQYGNTIAVAVSATSSTAKMTTVETALTYPASQLQFTGVTEGPVFTVTSRTAVGNGTIDIIRTVPGGNTGVSGTQPVITLNFKVIGSSGNAALVYGTAAGIYDATGSGNNILNKSASSGALFTISGLASQLSVSNSLSGVTLYNSIDNDPVRAQIAAWQSSRPGDALQLQKIANQPRARWFGGWSGDIQTATNSYVSAAASRSAVPVLVAYNIPFRDCGNYSAGGVSTSADYINWINGMANGINGRKAIVILEPDALGVVSCLSPTDQTARFNMLAKATDLLAAKGALVYIEASTWVSPSDMAGRLKQAGIANAAGFSVNVSGFNATSDMTNYGNQLSGLVGGKHFVIDTSRNGLGSNGEWCNPSGRGLGNRPQTFAGGVLDAYIWIKSPGESDGTCNGGPSAGQWWPDYALGLAGRAGY